MPDTEQQKEPTPEIDENLLSFYGRLMCITGFFCGSVIGHADARGDALMSRVFLGVFLLFLYFGVDKFVSLPKK